MDILRKLEKVVENKEYYTDVMTAQDLIKKLKSKLHELDSKSRFFDARFVRLGEDFDDGVVIIKFANALHTDDHNYIMKEAPTKLVIAIEGFNGKGKVNGHIRSNLLFFERMKNIEEGRGVFTDEHEKHKVNKEGTICEVAKHIVEYFKDNMNTFTDYSAKFQKRTEESQKLHEDAVAAPVTGTVSTPTDTGTQQDNPVPPGTDGRNQTTMSGIARRKRRLGVDKLEDGFKRAFKKKK